MIIEYIGGKDADRVLVTMDAAELDGCGVSFGHMSLSDEPTRALLRRLVAMFTRMGLRAEGEQVRVDCAPAGEGGCALLISRVKVSHETVSCETGNEYVFESADDIIAAYIAGVLPAGKVRRSGERWLLTGEAPAHPAHRRILSEYCLPPEE